MSAVDQRMRALAKRALDVAASAIGLLALSPVLASVSLLIWLEDRQSPFYVAPRVGKGGRRFPLVKLRSMVVEADRTGVRSTSKSDSRITRMGKIVRKLKLDEFPQLWNVLRGEMSLVGPRPQVERDVAVYTPQERRLLEVRPGITDFSSIVFADEGEILDRADDPDLRYNQVIRPWKSRLGLHYIRHRSIWLDVGLMLSTLLNIASRRTALALVTRWLERTGADPALVEVARRRTPLVATPPPGAVDVVQSGVPHSPRTV